MKTDVYTKSILTIIALCLTILTFTELDLIPKSYANSPTDNILNSKINYGIVPLNEDGSINVKVINSSEMDVNITGINTSDELDVNIDEVGGGYVSYGKLKVEID